MGDLTSELLAALLTATDETKAAALKAIKGEAPRQATPPATAAGDETTAIPPSKEAPSPSSPKRRRAANARTPVVVDATPDAPVNLPADTIAQIAEIFVGDMLRLEREYGLNAKQMLRYYKGELQLKKPEAEGGGNPRHSGR